VLEDPFDFLLLVSAFEVELSLNREIVNFMNSTRDKTGCFPSVTRNKLSLQTYFEKREFRDVISEKLKSLQIESNNN